MNDIITLTMTREQYEDMVYCMDLVRKQREKARKQYYEKRRKNKEGEIRSRKYGVEIPRITC